MAQATIMSPRCTVCTHENRMQIDHLLASGAEARATARRFGLSKDSVGRHYRDHVSDAWKASIKVGPFGSEENLRKLIAGSQTNNIETLAAYRAVINTQIIANAEVGAVGALGALLKAGHDNVSLHAKITGDLAPARSELTVNILQDPRTIRFVTRVMGLVRKFPETRADIAELVRECFGDVQPLPVIGGALETDRAP